MQEPSTQDIRRDCIFRIALKGKQCGRSVNSPRSFEWLVDGSKGCFAQQASFDAKGRHKAR